VTESNYCLTLFDTAGIQQYVFGANRLKENVGASHLVHQALSSRIARTCRLSLDGTYSDVSEQLQIFDNPTIAAELIFAGGGNAAVLFRSSDGARKVVRNWSRDLLRDAPGLRVAVAHEAVEQSDLKNAWTRCQASLQRAKDSIPPAPPLEGVSLTRACRSTGLAAAGWPTRDVDLSAFSSESVARAQACFSPVAAARWEAAPEAHTRLAETFKVALKGEFSFPTDVEQLGQHDGEQHMAVVHADGNRLGSRLSDIIQGAGSDAALVQSIRQFSNTVGQASQAALNDVFTWLGERYSRLVEQKLLRVRLDASGLKYLPIRPIVYGGDDVTFVCHGKLGLAVAAVYLRAFANRHLPDGTPLSACGGVAIVHTRAPFARAHTLASELCDSAKARSRTEQDSSWLDAQVALESLGEPLNQLRQRLYDRPHCRLDWRPWRVTPTANDAFDWNAVVDMMRGFETWPRSVRRTLMDSLGAGESAIQTVLSQQRFRGRAAPASLPGRSLEGGWRSSRRTLSVPAGFVTATPLYDPLELLEYAWEITSEAPI
jgi:hypothetical protein